jgi:hypothetical protein
MTLEDLEEIYNKAASNVAFLQYEGPDHRAGIRAVVAELRSEMHADPGCCWACEDNEKLLKSILASDGVEAEPTVGQRLTKAAKEAAAIAKGEAPAVAPVCEWTPRKYEMGFYATPHGIKLKDRRYDNCGICGLPIAIKSEAAR